MWNGLKYIDFIWCSKIASDNCQNLWKRHTFVAGNVLSSVLKSTAMSETAIKTLNLVIQNHSFEVSVCCKICFLY